MSRVHTLQPTRAGSQLKNVPKHSFPVLLITGQVVAVPAADATTASELLVACRKSGSSSWYRAFGHDALTKAILPTTTAFSSGARTAAPHFSATS